MAFSALRLSPGRGGMKMGSKSRSSAAACWLESPHSVWPLAGHSSFHSVSIKCMTHLSDAKKLKDFAFLLKGTI